MKNQHTCWTFCPECKGQGKIKRKLRKKLRSVYQLALEDYKNSGEKGIAPTRPKATFAFCLACEGKGIIPSESYPKPNKVLYPHVVIVGAGIGGMALGIACLHRGIPFTIYERDSNFHARSQGYGLTLQQASKAIKSLGITELANGIVSTRHVVHTVDGAIIGEWGMRKWLDSQSQKRLKRTNIHIARQALRASLFNELNDNNHVQWNHKLISFEENADLSLRLIFDVQGESKEINAGLLVGADGIRSTVRNLLIGDSSTPLHYLGCIVILGICSLNDLTKFNAPLLDSATVFQTVDGTNRMYMMPFDKEHVMWQFSFPIQENDAISLSKQGSETLKKETFRRIASWHVPIPQIVENTKIQKISGYPVYDRALLKPAHLRQANNITLIGDAAHPMSPFKGQGANQALLDALSLTRGLSKACNPFNNERGEGLRSLVLTDYESEMMDRTATKVKDSAKAVEVLHSELALIPCNRPRGKFD